MAAAAAILIDADAAARDWLDLHHDDPQRIISYDVKRCRRGVRICDVRVRERSVRDDHRIYVTARLADGTRILIDQRAAERLPSRFGFTVRGVGSRKHLELKLDGAQWGALLYDWADVLAHYRSRFPDLDEWIPFIKVNADYFKK